MCRPILICELVDRTNEFDFIQYYPDVFIRLTTVGFTPVLSPIIEERLDEEAFYDSLLADELIVPSPLPSPPTRRRPLPTVQLLRRVRRRLDFSESTFEDDSLDSISISSHESDYLSDGIDLVD